jgi:hypothetical protein
MNKIPIALAVLAAAVVPAVAYAQVQPQTVGHSCATCYSAYAIPLHTFNPIAGMEPEMFADCVVWNSCHLDVQAGWCANWHSPCQLSSVTTDAADRALAAVVAGDAPGLLQVLASTREIQYVADRNSLQVTGCGGEITANIPVGDELGRVLRATAATTTLARVGMGGSL